MSRLTRSLFTFLLLLGACISAPAQAPAKASGASKPASKPAAASTADADKLDINTATPDQLKALKGVGDAYTKRIIAGRPYSAKNQLSTRGILPDATYNAIKDQIIARAPKK